MKILFDRSIFNIILIHVARTWERMRLEQTFQEMPFDNIGSTDEIESVAHTIVNNEIIQEFLEKRNSEIWDRFGDGASDAYIERITKEIIEKEYL